MLLFQGPIVKHVLLIIRYVKVAGLTLGSDEYMLPAIRFLKSFFLSY